ncbi:MAG TPA: methyltransferase domain-containing protein, partial [Bacteroidetes bacterium]|nr:methyltransferase domain-containing protein [Bacteroidota bacterium]
MDAHELLLKLEKETCRKCDHILEVGSGSGELLRRLAQKHNASAVGVDPYISEREEGNIAFIATRAEDIDSLNRRFGLIYTVISFHHFYDPDRFFEKIKKTLAWHGRFIIVDWKFGTHTGVPEKYFHLSDVTALTEKHDLKILSKGTTSEHFYIVGTLPEFLCAVPTADNETIFPKMLGQAPFFHIYSCSGENYFQLIEKRTNIYAKTLQPQKTFDVYDEINDCQAILSARIGKNGIARLRDKGVKLFFD